MPVVAAAVQSAEPHLENRLAGLPMDKFPMNATQDVSIQCVTGHRRLTVRPSSAMAGPAPECIVQRL